MIASNQKTSLLVPYQLPEFIRDDPNYENFVLFLKAYYEWMELPNTANSLVTTADSNQGATYASKNLLSYKDIDTTIDSFINYFYNDFLSYFPVDALADKQKVIKFAKELYQTKGTPAAYQFLFRVLYNSDVEFFYTKDSVLRASAGKWYVPKSLKLSTNDPNILAANNLRVFGETTKSLATIETSVITGSRTEVFISDIERLFKSGEYVRVVDSNNQDVYFLNGQIVPEETVGASIIREKIIGQISQITINPAYRGTKYNVSDPVVVYGGFDPSIATTGHGAVATVGTVTTGAIQSLSLISGGYGYSQNTSSSVAGKAYTTISFSNLNSGSQAPVAQVAGVVVTSNVTSNVTMIPIDWIGRKSTVVLNSVFNFTANSTATINCSLANAFTFTSFNAYPISAVSLQNGGGGISVNPTITAQTLYNAEFDVGQGYLSNLGILAPIQISTAGSGYAVNDKINITGGSGTGAYANVLTVNGTGAITSVGYVYPSGETIHKFPLGGMGYTSSLPTLTITSSAGVNGVLSVPGILGTGASITASGSRIGQISTINVSDFGEDYISTPNVSLKVQDIIVSNVLSSSIPTVGDVVYQGSSQATATYTANVSSVSVLVPNASQTQTLYTLRVFNYTSTPNGSLPLIIDSRSLSMNISTTYVSVDSRFDKANGSITYGDGRAKANAKFLDGLVIGQGQYIDNSGQPSSFDVLQSDFYNNYTYEITVDKEIAKYRDILLNLLHPAGMKVVGRYAMKSNNRNDNATQSAYFSGHTLSYYTGTTGSSVTMSADFTNQSNNIIVFNNLAGADITTFIANNNTSIRFTTANGDIVSGLVTSITTGLVEDLLTATGSLDLLSSTGTEDMLNESSNDQVTIDANVWLAFANVAYVTGNVSSNLINIRSLTYSYNLVNDGVYSNTQYPLMDMVRAGDQILVANNSALTVQSVNYLNNTITLTSNLTQTTNSLMSVSRTLTTTGAYVQLFGPLGKIYIPEITTEDGNSLTTQDGHTLILLG